MFGDSGCFFQQPVGSQLIGRVTPSDPANLVVEENALKVYTSENEYLGQIEPKLARRLIRLIYGGNRYDAAILGVNAQAISIIVRETYRDRALNSVCAFPTRSKKEHRVYIGGNLVNAIGDDRLEDDDGPSIDEEAMDTDWSDGE